MDDDPYSKKRKGGLQQRLAAAKRQSVEDSAVETPSLLCNWLQQQWAWGRFSPQEIQHIAMLAKRDSEAAGATRLQKPLCSLASLGSEGSHGNNCHRGLFLATATVCFHAFQNHSQNSLTINYGAPFSVSSLVGVIQRLLEHLFSSRRPERFRKLLAKVPGSSCNATTLHTRQSQLAEKLHTFVPAWGRCAHSGLWKNLGQIDSSIQLGIFIVHWVDQTKVFLHLGRHLMVFSIFFAYCLFSALKQQKRTSTLVALCLLSPRPSSNCFNMDKTQPWECFSKF